MGEKTKIPWCDHTFSPWWGCENVSPGCAHCYAEGQANRFQEGLWGKDHAFRFFGDKHWVEPLAWNRKAETGGVRKRVFCASMADVFEEREELLEPRVRLFELIDATPQLDWLILTKRPEFMRDWFYAAYYGPDPSKDMPVSSARPLANLWAGVTIENARYTYRADILREIPAAVRFISAEPLLGSLFEHSDEPGHLYPQYAPLDLTGIDWVIAGAESGPKARPMDEEWVRELRDACLNVCGTCLSHEGIRPSCEARPAFFYKQQIAGGRKIECPELDGRQWMEFPR